MIYQHPLAYLIALEGRALLKAWAGDDDYDQRFVTARLAEVRRLLDDDTLAAHPGALVERDATGTAYEQWAVAYDNPGNGLFDLDTDFIDEVLDTLPVGLAVDAGCGTGRLTSRLVGRGHHVLGVDGSLPMLQRARRLLPDTVLAVGDLHRLPVSDHRVDLVVTGLALTHVADVTPVFAEIARVLRPGGHLLLPDVHEELVLLGSVVKAVGSAGQPQLAATHRHSVSDYLRAALATGYSIRRFEEQPRPRTPEGPVDEPTREIGSWQEWPWTLLGFDPEATRAAWNSPAVVLWHFQLD